MMKITLLHFIQRKEEEIKKLHENIKKREEFISFRLLSKKRHVKDPVLQM
jgi:hypothetical protein